MGDQLSVTAFGIRRPRALGLVMAFVVIAGTVAYYATPRQEDPAVRGNGFFVEVYYPGADTGKLEDFAVKPVERRMNELPDVLHTMSYIRREMGYVFCELAETADIRAAVADARRKLEELRSELPKAVPAPRLHEFYTGDIPVAVYGVAGPFEPQQFRDFARDFEDRLRNLDGVLRVEVEGLLDRRVEVVLNPDLLARHRLDLLQVEKMVAERNLDVPAGSVAAGTSGLLVRSSNELRAVEDLAGTVVAVSGTAPVALRDVAQVRLADVDRRYRVRVNGQPGFCIYVRPRPDANLFALTALIERGVAEAARRLPEGALVVPLAFQRDTAARIVSNFESNLTWGSLLVAAVIYAQLGWRQTVVILCAIPLSILCSITVLSLLGFTYHKVSVFSLVLVLGMLVDNAIIMVEAITARLARGGGGRERLVVAASEEMASPILGGVFTTIASFIPLFMMSGMVGDYVKDMPWVGSIAILFSLFTTLVFTPALCAWLLEASPKRVARGPRRFDPAEHGWFGVGYASFMRFALRWRWSMLLACVASFVGALALIPTLGLELFPDADRDHFVVEVRTPEEYGLESTAAAVARVEELVRGDPVVTSVLTYVGMSVPRFHYNIVRKIQENFGHMVVRVRDHAEIAPLIDRIRRSTADLSDCRLAFMRIMEGPYTGLPVALYVKGADRAQASLVADRLMEQLASIPGAVDLERDEYRLLPQFSLDVDEGKAAMLGLSGAAVARTVRGALEGDLVTRFDAGTATYDVVVKLDLRAEDHAERLRRLAFQSPGGAWIPLDQIARLRLEPQLSYRYRRDGKPGFRVRCDVSGVLPDTILARMRALPKEFVPPDCAIEYGGETESRDRSFATLLRSMVWAVLLNFFILVAEFNSFVQPFIILFNIPLAVVGAVVGLFVMGYPFGFMAFLGLVTIVGVVVDDDILLIDGINRLRAGGIPAADAIVQAGIERHKAVYLTTVTTILGTLPLGFNGGSLWEPLAWVVVFGMGASTILSLVVTPLGYAIAERV